MPKFSAIIAAVRTELATNVLSDLNRVIPLARRKTTPKLTGDQDILLRVKGANLQPGVEGGGRHYMPMRRILEVIPRSRKGTDEVGKDTNWLLEELDGFLALEDKIINRLELFMPTSRDSATHLTIEPMRFLGTVDPDKDIDPDGKWGASVLQYEVIYQQDLDVTRAGVPVQ